MELNTHTLSAYDQQLRNLMQLILDMGGEVRKMVQAAKLSFRSADANRAAEAKAADKVINALDNQIEEQATIVLALLNPVAIDLRFVTSVFKITGMLERAGDLAKNTIKRSTKTGTYTPDLVIRKLERMADVVVEMLDGALQAFQRTDSAQAISVWKRDQEIDDLYHEAITIIEKDMSASPEHVGPGMHFVFAAKNLERLADYVTNIAKQVYYVNSGTRASKAVLKDEA